jgi:hypothetical protein
MTTLSILVGVCIWVLGSYKLEAHESLMGSLKFFPLDCGQVIVLYCLCLLDAIVELYPMDEKILNGLLIGN